MENIDPKTKIGNMFQRVVEKYELLIIALIILVICLSVFKVPNVGLPLTLVLMSASIIYFFCAFAIPKETEFTALDSFLHKLVSWGSTVALIGVLFIIQKWPNGDTMNYVGLLTLGICLIAMAYQKIRNPESEKFNKLIFLRIITLLIISGGFLYLSK